MTRLTLKSVREALKDTPVTIRKEQGIREYRVSFREGTNEQREASAYYTEDLADALGTAEVMIRWKKDRDREEAAAALNKVRSEIAKLQDEVHFIDPTQPGEVARREQLGMELDRLYEEQRRLLPMIARFI